MINLKKKQKFTSNLNFLVQNTFSEKNYLGVNGLINMLSRT